ncbi:HipA N-terminal domain-containing protein [Rouxiella badensis]|uniref:HipA N-terminal domain-containing protein n=1 Tax=Rouxiella badensis TaxID=1646377 RepID=UPI001D1330E8|nr:HipA N-terminal domain-containing protein [Rouxiella badensis]MCC3721655.1 HipA N-terminal domain-containing protein [Rouxiella badensis]MCC3731297.1 HipA N-terminal domain-containing protein [Rouxiella badensis]MCC3735879.1 HipA N-terminal domain-containing protein [Rouxiella badensis]MCC3742875.1 HipA N-terminal domain-containing protein [Rouxiella badensis]MCC3761176.1 HipA N-terminal domain-containing protein [Rouxiella badensis]
MARKIEVWLYNKPIGILGDEPNGFVFSYHSDYTGRAVSLSMPVRSEPYYSDELHPFFKGLAPEGWLRKRYSEIQKIDDKDLFGLLIENGNDLLGAVVLREMTS